MIRRSLVRSPFALIFSLGLFALACESAPELVDPGGQGGSSDDVDGTGGKKPSPSGGSGSGDDISEPPPPPPTGGGGGEKPVEVPAVCGDGEVGNGELCDDGNEKDGDGCSADCTEVDPDFLCVDGEPCKRVVTCGNGILEGDEVCDDGDTLDNGCSPECDEVADGFACAKPGVLCTPIPICGNGERERGEQCDDGDDTDPDDGCDECLQADGFFCPPGESCVPLICGDGNRTPDEKCDDGNTGDGDGCSGLCEPEDGYRCSAGGCVAICGDGVILDDEECDDAARVSGDGCSAGCKEEAFYNCSGEPSTCSSTIVCGNGVLEPGEVCDPGISGQANCFATGAAACDGYDNTLVDPPVCGNHVIELLEECDGDQGNQGCVSCEVQDGFVCPKADYCIRLPVCGDSILQAGEECDVGPASVGACIDCEVQPNYFCSGDQPSVCVASICGDGFRAPDEQCDDGPGVLGSPGTPVGGDGCSSTCTLETGYACPPNKPCQPVCGDGVLVTPKEQCEEESAGCTNCRINAGYDCDANGENCAATVCGNGQKEAGEGCDFGDLVAGDGCGPTCQLEPTVTVGPSPSVAIVCGDGLKTSTEECDDGNATSGDGCSATCTEELGWYCSESATYPDAIDFKVTYRDFKPRTVAGGHPHMKLDGSYPAYGTDPGIVGAVCTTANSGSCGRLDAQGKPTYVGSGTHNTIDPSGDSLSAAYHQEAFRLWYRDTNSNSAGNGTVNDALSESDGNGATNTAIVLTANPGTCTDGSGVCATAPTPTTTVDTLTLSKVSGVGQSGTASPYRFASSNNTFYPLGSVTTPTTTNRGFGYVTHGQTKNWHFTSELRYFFQFQGGEDLTFVGDDDVWVFVNGRLAVDIGGIHCTQWGRVVLGDEDSSCSVHGGDYDGGSCSSAGTLADCNRTGGELTGTTDNRFGLVKGNVYEIVVFQAERSPDESNYQLTLDGFIAPRSHCQTDCGDSVVAGSEVCDEGPFVDATEGNQPSGYGVCLENAQSQCIFTYCGDGSIQSGANGPETCDNGLNVDLYDDGSLQSPCSPECKAPPYCGDGSVQSAFEVCDDGVNDGSWGGCMPGCQALAGYCGDHITQSPEEECDPVPPATFLSWQQAQGACGFDCQFAGYCGDGIRNGDEVCDDPMDPNCNANCQFDPFCGDGVKTSNEACDNGVFNVSTPPVPYDGCSGTCTLGPHCGDGTPQLAAGEECDKGAENAQSGGVVEYEGCSADCLNGPFCGDGNEDAGFGEGCDNGFNADTYAYPGQTDACGEGCQDVPYCGDSQVQSAFELCDNGPENSDTAYNGCTSTCEWGPYCGDGDQDAVEECDDGLDNVAYAPDGNGCSYECKRDVPYCGDGERNGPERCDDGTDENTGEYGGCNPDCTRAPYCGDGIRQKDAGEDCDDGPAGSLTCYPDCKERSVIITK